MSDMKENSDKFIAEKDNNIINSKLGVVRNEKNDLILNSKKNNKIKNNEKIKNSNKHIEADEKNNQINKKQNDFVK